MMPSSEILPKCRIIGPEQIKDSDVTGYYTDDHEDKKQNIANFFSDSSLKFKISAQKVAEYKKLIIAYVFPKRELFANKMDTFLMLTDYFSSKDIEIPKMFFGGKTGRYLKFDNTNDDSKKFKEIIYDGVSNIIIEKREDCYLVYPKLRDDFFRTLNLDINELSNEVEPDEKASFGENKIYYGTPGCGKSYFIKHTILGDVPKENIFRTTFYPDYANSDFVGQIMPQVKKIPSESEPTKFIDSVTYSPVPGPFALALKRARECNSMVYLVIEEINRGNASSIFGDIFQLLDRNKDPNLDNYSESEYAIKNLILADYFGVDRNTDFIIPSNLTILATMNTSDQNVFSLDTAFKRRWNFEQIPNDVSKCPYRGYFVPNTNCTWERFLKVVNDSIVMYQSSNSSSEDKQLGVFFVDASNLLLQVGKDDLKAKLFAYKVLEYLWDDVFKFSRGEVFDTEMYPTLEKLVKGFCESSDSLDIFNGGTIKFD